MSRVDRRLLRATMRKQAEKWPDHLVPVPESEWPARRSAAYPVELWRSRHYLVAVFEEAQVDDRAVWRLSINRVTVGADGRWEQGIPWEELQRCKREVGFGDSYALEVYPRDRDVVNVANMRHLWVLSAPLGIGWFDGRGPEGT